MPNRDLQADYRYGYQGEYSEKEELGATHSFELRLWDARIGRWMSPDPYGQFSSPYLGMGNRPNIGVDADGGCTTEIDGKLVPCPVGFKGADYFGDYYDASNIIPDDTASNLYWWQNSEGDITGMVDLKNGIHLESSKTMTPFDIGYEWLTGTGPNHRNFTNGDDFTEKLRDHQWLNEVAVPKAVSEVIEGGKDRGDNYYGLGGIEGVGKYIKDYSTLLTGGLTGNIAVTFLGSYYVTWNKITIDEKNRQVHIQFTVRNSSTASSALRLPVLGYTDAWKKNIAPAVDKQFPKGPASKKTQAIKWIEIVNY